MKGWHLLRHSFPSNLAVKGVDQPLIDAWMGHQTEETEETVSTNPTPAST
jgi:hypothetical protein